MIAEPYRAQVDLLLRLLPFVAREPSFALKGGTAINLFVRDMPRLSVDIDLTYLPIDDRNTALDAIASALKRIAGSINRAIPGIQVASHVQAAKEDKLVCRLGAATVKNRSQLGASWPPVARA